MVLGKSVFEDEISLEPWDEADLPLLQQLLADPRMTVYLGGPESPEKIAERQQRYQRRGSRQFKIVDSGGNGIGYVGYWEREWRGEEVYEIGWSVLPAYQGRGIAVAATKQALELARAELSRRFVHAYPSVENAPSNAICRKVGFTLLGSYEFEYPPGNPVRCNDWRFDLLQPPS